MWYESIIEGNVSFALTILLIKMANNLLILCNITSINKWILCLIILLCFILSAAIKNFIYNYINEKRCNNVKN